MKKNALLPAGLLAAGLLTLSSCGAGLIPLPAIDLGNLSLTLPAADESVPYVLYSTDNSLASSPDLAKYLSGVSLGGNASYSGAGTLSKASVYVRSDLSGCTADPGGKFVLCPASGESANDLGQVTLVNGQTSSVRLLGAALTNAVKARTAYFGVKIDQGASANGDQIQITDVKVSANL